MHIVSDKTGEEIHILPPKLQAAKNLLAELFKPVIKAFDAYIIPDGEEQKIIDHSLSILSKNATMKPERIARKTAEYFKLKKVQKK